MLAKKNRIVDLSLPIIDGGGFNMPARLRYIGHQTRGRMLADRFGLDLTALGGMANSFEEFDYLNCHTATHMDAPWHYNETSCGKPAKTIDQIPLEWCFGNGVWLDMSGKKAGETIEPEDIKNALTSIEYELKAGDIVLFKTGASAHYGKPDCDLMHPGFSRKATLWLAD